MRTNNYQKRIELVKYTAKELTQRLPYHNFRHETEVYLASAKLAVLENIDDERKFLLKTAALLHDIIVVSGRTDNEERSAEFAREYLPKIDYSDKQAEKVAELILATKMPQKPRNLLEKIICDADLENLGSKDFFEWSEKLREELGIQEGAGWYRGQIDFLQSHQYHTESARRLRGGGKKRNIKKLKRLAGGRLKC